MDNYDNIEVGRIYQHFKGNLYLVTGVSTNAETDEEMIEYHALYGDCAKYVRRKKSFTSAKDKNNCPIILRQDNVTNQMYCFELVSDKFKTVLCRNEFKDINSFV